jgi:uncharacterized RDD family membrane protein YckC
VTGQPATWGDVPATSSASAGGAAVRTGHAADGIDDAWVTPDAVALDVDIATVGSRGIAYLLDLSIVLSALLLIQLGQVLLGLGGFVPGWLPIAVLLVAAFALQFGYPIGFEVLWRGRTLGKAVMGLRVVTVEGAPVGFRHAAIRAAAGVFELLATLGFPAIVTSFESRHGQRLGDLAAGTVVVRERRASRPVQALRYPVPPGWEGYVRTLDVGRLDPLDRAVIRDTLRRAHELRLPVRHQVMVELADALLERTAPPPPLGTDAETFVRCVAARLAERVEGPIGAGGRAVRGSQDPGWRR